MSSFVSQLNLRPHERRLLFLVVAVVFVVVNVAVVWPRFDDWKDVRDGLAESRQKRAEYQAEIDRANVYRRQIRELEGQGGAVLPEEQALQLLRTVQEKARAAGVAITQTRASTTASAVNRTNTFFDEQAITIGVSTDAPELIDFLYAIGSGESMIRVRDMDLRPDQQHYKLQGSLTLVASYQQTKPRSTGGSRRGASAKSKKP